MGGTNLDTFFRDSKEIQEWIDLLIENLLTVSTLSENEADSEFYEGRQAAEKVISFLKQIPQLPEDKIMDGIQQLVEQRLPDHREIENTPAFYQLMNDMIKAGLQGISNDLPQSIPCSVVTLAGGNRLRVQNPESNNCIAINKHRWNMKKKGKAVEQKTADQRVKLLDEWKSEEVINEVINNENVVEKEKNLDSMAYGEDNLEPGEDTEKDEELKVVEELPEVEKNKDVEAIEETKNLIEEEVKEELAEEITEGIREDVVEEVKESPEEKVEDENGNANNTSKKNDVKSEATAEVKEQEEPLENKMIEAVSIVNLGNSQGTKSSFSPFVKISPSTQTPNSFNKIVRNTRIPTDAGRLARVLKELFPKSSVRWNLTLGSYKFYAQVDNLLIYVLDHEESLEESEVISLKKSFKRQGWYVFTCNKEDLAYPRRLERGIKLSVPKRKS